MPSPIDRLAAPRRARPFSASSFSARPFWITAFAAAVLCAGCGKRDEIAVYTVRSESALRKENSVPKGMAGAIADHAGQTWFFKLSGTAGDVETAEKAFRDFLGNVRFESGQPKWTLPEGWVEKNSGPLRFATIEVPGTAMPLDLSISSLSTPAGEGQKFLLANVNRWRRQLGLEPLSAGQLDDELTTVTLADGTAASLMIAEESRANENDTGDSKSKDGQSKD